jgi:hypothetical protein
MLNNKNINQLLSEALAIEASEAKEAGALGFMARALTLATMPHSKPEGNEFIRKNGSFTMTMLAPSSIGLPYGSIPRLLLAWMTTEAVKTQSKELILGDSMSAFMRELGLVPTGGRWGSITRLKSQTRKLFGSAIHCDYIDKLPNGVIHESGMNIHISDNYSLWWEPKNPEQKALFNSTVTLTEPFFKEIISSPVPIDMRALKALKQSPMALDIYVWLTYRMSYLSKSTQIPWQALQAQFGAGYPMTARGTRNFKAKFITQLKKVLVVYPEAKADEGDRGLRLKPSKTHVPKLSAAK